MKIFFNTRILFHEHAIFLIVSIETKWNDNSVYHKTDMKNLDFIVFFQTTLEKWGEGGSVLSNWKPKKFFFFFVKELSSLLV